MKRFAKSLIDMAWSLIPISIALVTAVHGQGLDPNNICGARCVHRILESLTSSGHQLQDAVQDISNDADLHAPSLLDLSEYLENQGLFTRIIAFDNEPLIDLKCAKGVYLIAHLKPTRDTPENVGHFLIWLGTNSNVQQLCWDGLRGEVILDAETFRTSLSGSALVVARTESEAMDGVTMRHLGGPWTGVRELSSVTFISALVVFLVLLRRIR